MVYPIVVFPAKHYNDAYHNMGYALRDDETGDFFCGFHYPEGYGHGLCRQAKVLNKVANSRPGHTVYLCRKWRDKGWLLLLLPLFMMRFLQDSKTRA